MKTMRSWLWIVAIPVVTVIAGAQNPDEVYRSLQNSTIWVHPSAKDKVDVAKVESAAGAVKPSTLKVLVIPSLGKKWVKNGNEMRGSFAKYVNDSKLNLGDRGITIVLTNRGISAYTQKLSASQLTSLDDLAKRSASSTDYTPAITALAQSVATELKARPQSRAGLTNPSPIQEQKSNIGGWLCIGIPLLIAAVVGLAIWAGKRAKVKQAKALADKQKALAIEQLSHLDSYDGLLSGQAADATRQYRDRMAQSFDEGQALLTRAKSEQDFQQAQRVLKGVEQDFDSAKGVIDRETGGSGVAFKIPPRIDYDKAPLMEPVKGVSFFSSQPSDQLLPVEVNFGGQRRTVMVTPSERDELLAGRMPQMRGQYQGDDFMPWYQVRGYDPYNHYGSNDFLWNMVAFSAISSMFQPHYGYGFGGHGWYGGGGPTYITNNYGDPVGYGGGSDFGSGTFDNASFQDQLNSGGDFNFGGDSGGGDFGGSNDSSSGGGWDFGGGGDSGGGDFGGGDFGGGGDSGGGGGDW